MIPKVSKRYLLYSIELHKSILRTVDTPSIKDEHVRAIERLEKQLEEEYPNDQDDRREDSEDRDG